jgi:hypothetical protein
LCDAKAEVEQGTGKQGHSKSHDRIPTYGHSRPFYEQEFAILAAEFLQEIVSGWPRMVLIP